MESLERMAREYKELLQKSSTDDPAIVEQIIILEENQLDLLNRACCLNPLQLKTVNYLKNLIFRTLNKLNLLIGNSAYIPSFRNNVTCSTIRNDILNTQIDILILTDKLNLAFSDIADLLSLENRKLSLISSLL